MIGTNIRGMRHLWRVSDYSVKKILTRCGDYGFEICEVLKTKPNSLVGEHMFILNHKYNHHNTIADVSHLCSLCKELKIELNNSHDRVVELRNNENDFKLGNDLFTEITLLPDSFDEDYAYFLKENSKMINNLTRKYDIDANDVFLKRMYIYTSGSKNFFQWAVDLHFKSLISTAIIKSILTWKDHYKQLTKKLSKGTITAYTTSRSVGNLIDELVSLRNEKRINDAISSFNTAQKKILKNHNHSEIDKATLAKFAKLSEVKKTNFIQKVSTINDYDEIMHQMRNATSMHFEWSKESFMDFINNVDGINCELIYESEHIVLVKVLDYETIKQLGKTTNWCISKNKTYWNNYIGHFMGKSEQYVIFDFSKIEDDKFSIIGFTTTFNYGITSAHNFVNENLISNENDLEASFIKSFLLRFKKNNCIYQILQDCGVDIMLIAHYDKPKYDWNYDDFMSYLYECVDRNNVEIIKHEGSKLVLSVHDENIKYFFGDTYFSCIDSNNYGKQHIIFADFSKSKYDVDRLTVAIILNGGEEDYCQEMFNSFSQHVYIDFNSKLAEFNLPYDTIRRVDDIKKKTLDAFFSYNTKTLMKYIKENNNCLHNAIKSEKVDEIALSEILTNSITKYLSFDYLNIIYDSGHYISDYVSNPSLSRFLNLLYNNIKVLGENLYHSKELKKPSEKRIEEFYQEKLNNIDDVKYVGYYLALKKILTHENQSKNNFDEIYCKILSNIYNSKLTGSLIKELVYLMLNNIDMFEKTPSSNYIVYYFIECGDNEMKNTIASLSEKYVWIEEVLAKRMKRQEEKSIYDEYVCTVASPFIEDTPF